MWVTCYTDASFNRKGAGWAVWLRSSAGRKVRHGKCPSYVKSSNDAELAAIFAGIWLAVRTWGELVEGVLVCSDCQGALGLLQPGHPTPRRPGTRRLQEKTLLLLEERGIRLRTKWVKGHQHPSRSTAAFLNDRCDSLAREARTAAAEQKRR